MTHDLIIIGAGAAGLFAAANVPPDWNTLVLEKTASPGQKLLLTGSGQCNLTNDKAVQNFLTHYGKNGKSLRQILFPFSNLALMAYFERHGLPLETRPDGKVFPTSSKSQDVLNLLLREAKTRGVTIRYHTPVTDLRPQSGTDGSLFVLTSPAGQFSAKNVLVTTGGASYPQTGSDGTFFACLERLGIPLVPLRPALTPLFVQNYPYGALSGISFPSAAVSISPRAGGRPFRVEGDLLLTHRGFSGPAILASSRYVTQGDKLEIHYLPTETPDALRRTLLDTATGDARQIVTLLESVTSLPHRFLEHICRRAGLETHAKASRLTGQDMTALSALLTADTYEISGTGGFSTAMATAGGVALDEIHLQSLESKKHPGLYFAGEVLDVDGDTGGYNLQFAFSSAKRSIEAMHL